MTEANKKRKYEQQIAELFESSDYPYAEPHPILGQSCCPLNLTAAKNSDRKEMPITVLYMEQHKGSLLNQDLRIVLGAEPGLGYAIRIHVTDAVYNNLEQKSLKPGTPIGIVGHFHEENLRSGMDRNGINFEMHGSILKTEMEVESIKEMRRTDNFYIQNLPPGAPYNWKCKRFGSIDVITSKMEGLRAEEVICPPGSENKLAVRIFPIKNKESKKMRPSIRPKAQYRFEYIDFSQVEGRWTITANDISNITPLKLGSNTIEEEEKKREALNIEEVDWSVGTKTTPIEAESTHVYEA